MENDIEVRALLVEDVFAIARMLGKITKGVRQELASTLTAKKPNPTEIGMVLFQSVFTVAEEDLKAWLATLIGKEKAEFEAMPATTILDIVEKLVEQEDIKTFFAKASSLVNKLAAAKPITG